MDLPPRRTSRPSPTSSANRADRHAGAAAIPRRSIDDGGTRPRDGNAQVGESFVGIASLPCATCHRVRNDLPCGAPDKEGRALAPVEMPGAARRTREICGWPETPARNGDRTPAEMAEHAGRGLLVRPRSEPVAGREPAPGTRREDGAAILARADVGAPCP